MAVKIPKDEGYATKKTSGYENGAVLPLFLFITKKTGNNRIMLQATPAPTGQNLKAYFNQIYLDIKQLKNLDDHLEASRSEDWDMPTILDVLHDATLLYQLKLRGLTKKRARLATQFRRKIGSRIASGYDTLASEIPALPFQKATDALWAFACLGIRPPDIILAALERNISAYAGQAKERRRIDSDKILWSLATLGRIPEQETLPALKSDIGSVIKNADLKDISKFARSCAIIDSLSQNGDTECQNIAILIFDEIERRFSYKNTGDIKDTTRIHHAALWFDVTGTPAPPKEAETVSRYEDRLYETFNAAGMPTSEDAARLDDIRREVDLALKIKDRTIYTEVDGPYHFLHGQDNKLYFNGNTIFQSRLIQKYYPESVLIRWPFFIFEKIGDIPPRLARDVLTEAAQSPIGTGPFVVKFTDNGYKNPECGRLYLTPMRPGG